MLESNAHLLEDYPDLEPPEPYPEEDQEAPPAAQPPPSPDLQFDPEVQIIGHKRSRSDSPDVSLSEAVRPSEEKRGRADDSVRENDEDWLRYSPSQGSDHAVEERVNFVKEKMLSRYASEIDGECMPVTAPNGDRVYAKLNRSEGEERLKKLDVRANSHDLISEPINILFEKLEQEAFTKTLKASTECESVPDVPETPVVHEKLWVDKYTPKSFTELLSDEHTNREVLLWLKQWDSSVFGSEIRSTSDEVLSALKRHSTVAHHQKPLDSKFSRMKRGPKWSNNTYRHSKSMDETGNSNSIQDILNKKSKHIGPPEQKILLLCGPPGLGKTTLAHVAGRHCGYHVVEVNASDDRSTSTIEAKILDVVQMNSVMSDSRPKCLVVDEIDGALTDGKGAVEVLLKMVSAEKKSDVGKETLAKEHPGRKSSKKGRHTTSLSRPVICICNDLYAPALRPLRQVAKLWEDDGVSSSHTGFTYLFNQQLAVWLKYICNKEGMKANAIALTALAEYTECDIRSCLNTLQFLSKKKETLNAFPFVCCWKNQRIVLYVRGREYISKTCLILASLIDYQEKYLAAVFFGFEDYAMKNKINGFSKFDIGSQVVGRKDVSRNVLDVWKEVFQRKKTKMERKSCSSKPFEFNSLYSLLSNRGDGDLILDGIHENILQLSYHDPVMQKTVKCLNSLGVYDLLHQYIMRTQQMPLQVYLPSIAITVNRLVAQVQKPNIEWPRSYQRFRTMMTEKMDILNTWHYKIPPQIARHLSAVSFVEDLISPLLHILTPPSLKPVALQLLSDKEKKDLVQLVSTMVSYSITYKNTKSDVLPNSLRHVVADDLSLDPPIGGFINFKDYTSNHYVLSLAMKQIIVHEVEKQKILQVNIDRHSGNESSSGRHELIEAGTSNAQSSKINHAAEISVKNIQNENNIWEARKYNANAAIVSPNLHPDKGVTDNVKLLNTGSMKKPSAGSFFDRFRKLSSKGLQSDDRTEKKEASLEIDSRPLLFKFNECKIILCGVEVHSFKGIGYVSKENFRSHSMHFSLLKHNGKKPYQSKAKMFKASAIGKLVLKPCYLTV
ncbi:chromosome transmission fidelity protein 18-like protein [Senna tora]|uniref:Chromosome transmission fidelity protein 18-like protein n=1 Tax=Senna tora TaxID=362788 RepID=A0A834X490_9FABA|nr:chromosome transmission fidelity protein 18-like protein [Senna tora]